MTEDAYNDQWSLASAPNSTTVKGRSADLAGNEISSYPFLTN